MTEVPAIKAVRAASNAAIKAHDLNRIEATFAPDVHVTVGSGDKIMGREAVMQAFQAQFAANPALVFVRTPKTIKISRSGTETPLAFEEGSWVAHTSGTPGAGDVSGQYAAGWRKSATGWHIHSEIFVTLQERGG